MFDRFFDATKAQYIARPESAATELVYRHPDTNIPRSAKLTVRSDEVAVFFREGRSVGVLQAGAYVLDTKNIPFLGQLVSVVTGGNHYLAELFFVRTAETPVGIGASELGSFVDVNSRNLLRLYFEAAITVTVRDPLALITQLGGQSSSSGEMIDLIVGGRLRNALKAIIATEAQRVPIYNIISNASGEDMGRVVMERVAPEFVRSGLEFVRFVDLHVSLDEESEALRRSYQQREAELVIDAKGAQVAADPGFAVFNAVKGSRSVAEGLGTGFSQGFSGPVIGMGIGGGMMPGLGVGMSARAAAPTVIPVISPRGATASVVERFFIRGAAMGDCPYTARQVVLWALGSGRAIDALEVRLHTDPPELWSPASAEPSIAAEWQRRKIAGGGASIATSSTAPGVNASFEAALAQAFLDKRLTPDEIPLLAALAVTARLASNDAEARTMIRDRALAAGCIIEELAESNYTYYDGATQQPGLSARDVATRAQATPSATHFVWTPALGNWTDPRAVPEIASVIAQLAPPPPPPAPSSPPPPPAPTPPAVP